MRAINSYLDIPSCVAWFDTLGGLTLSAGTLIEWADQSGAGISSSAKVSTAIAGGLSAAIGPTYTASDATWGGKPSLTWGGGETCLDTDAFASPMSHPFTWLMAGMITGSATASGRVPVTAPNAFGASNAINETSTGTASAAGISDSHTLFPVFGPSFSAGVPVNQQLAHGPTTVPFILCASSSTTSDLRFHINLTCVTRTRPPTGAPRTQPAFRFGRIRANATLTGNWGGNFNAFVVYNRFLSEIEARSAIILMARRQGVTLPTRSAKTRVAVPVPGAVGGRTWIL